MIRINAQVLNGGQEHQVTLTTNGNAHNIAIAPKPDSTGSSANGGELLFLALATCYCNDIYREAARRNIVVKQVQVEVKGEFAPKPGSIAENMSYNAVVEADASEAEILALMQHTDTVSEIQNTLRAGVPITLDGIKVISA